MHKVSSSIAYAVVCTLACVTNVLLANMLATIVLSTVPQTPSAVRPLSRVEQHLRAKANSELIAQAAIVTSAPAAAAIVARPAVERPKMSLGVLVAALDSAETSHAPDLAEQVAGWRRIQVGVPPAGRTVRAASKKNQAAKNLTVKTVAAKTKSAKIKVAKAAAPVKPRGTRLPEIMTASSAEKMLLAANTMPSIKSTRPVMAAVSQRLRLAETPGEMMFRGLLGRSS